MRPDDLIGLLQPLSCDTPPSLLRCDVTFEIAFWFVALALCLALLIFRPAALPRIEAAWKRFSRKRGLAVAFTIVSALLVRAALLPLLPIPEPVVHDEYSYLLGAQTFAGGRITNPTPPLWEHLETFHVNMWPTYQSMYPPGQALLMAIPLSLHLHPWWGIWLSVGLMCGAICWMLQAWMPPQWAFLGGMFCVLRFATFCYWMNSYWGGALAATGGALVVGSLPRLRRLRKARYAALLCLGLCLLANTRPYEGAVFSALTLLLVAFTCLASWAGGSWFGRFWRGSAPLSAWWFGLPWVRHGWAGVNSPDAPLAEAQPSAPPAARAEKLAWLKVSAVAVCLLAVTGAAMAYYNWRSTGNALLMPYVENQYQYHITRPFIWQERYPIPHYRHAAMRRLYVYHELPDYLNRRFAFGLWRMYKPRIQIFYDFYLWPMLGLLVPTFAAILRSRRIRPLVLSTLALLAGLALEQWPLNPHYAAPVLCAVIAMVLYSLRILRLWKPRGLPFGQMMFRSIAILFSLWCVANLTPFVLNPYRLGMYQDMPAAFDRCRLEAQLEQTPGKHVIIVHNRRSAFNLYDWVYNQPDPSQAKVIWVRDMGPAANQELVRFYSHRHIWIVEQDDGIMRLRSYSEELENTDPMRIINVAANQPVPSGR